MLALFEEEKASAEYLVGWVDGFAEGSSLGRGLVHTANYVHDDPSSSTTLRASFQDLPDTALGIVPRSRLWLAMRATVNDAGMRFLNTARYLSGALKAGNLEYWPHAHFHFLLDYVPNWKRSFQPLGIEQYQIFIPRSKALSVFATVLHRSQQAGFIPYLGVVKLHREEDFQLRYNVDGYSLALDYHATARNLPALRRFLREMTVDMVLPSGGRFYPAKDTILLAEDARRVFGEAAVDGFLALKREIDPEEVLQSDLYRRLLVSGSG
jgi:hypothetical protein